MSVKQQLKELEKGSPAPVYVCYGSETYLRGRFISGVIEKCVEPELRDFAVSRYDLAETPLDAVLDDAQTLPFMAERKVIVAYNALFFSSAKESGRVEHRIERLTEYLKAPVDFTTLIFVLDTDKLDERKKLVKTIKDGKAALAFSPLSPDELADWIGDQAKRRAIAFGPGAQERLLLNAGAQLQTLDMELEKLALHVGRGGTVSETLIDQLVARGTEQNVFLLIDEIVKLRLDRAIDLFYELLKMKEEPIKIVALMARQFRIMYQVKELEKTGYSQQQIAGQIGSHPYAVKLASEQARRFESKRLTELIASLAELDYRIKSGRADKVLGVELFILRLAA